MIISMENKKYNVLTKRNTVSPNYQTIYYAL